MASVFVLGGHQTDFARNLTREGLEISDLVAAGVAGTLEDAQVAATEVQSIHVGNAFGQLFTGQGHLGGMPATVEDGLWGVPAGRHEGACASGSLAVLSAMAEIEAGRYDCVLVLGVELERNVGGEQAARNLGAAAWVGHESTSARYLWPSQFSELEAEYEARYGIDHAHLTAISAKNYANAQSNPNAQTRSWNTEGMPNPPVEGTTNRLDCSQVTDGAAGVVLVSEAWALAHHRGPLPRIAGWGHTGAGLSLQSKLERSRGQKYVLPHVRTALTDAWRRAGIGTDGPDGPPVGLDAIEVHDCFTVTEYAITDHLGLASPGEAWKAIENGETQKTGTLPVNPSGGLIGGGHPVGATGVRMLLDATRQVTGRAEGTQVEGAKQVGTLNIGGSTTTTVAFVVSAE